MLVGNETMCEACPVNSYRFSDDLFEYCHACPDYQFTASNGSTGEEACTCECEHTSKKRVVAKAVWLLI